MSNRLHLKARDHAFPLRETNGWKWPPFFSNRRADPIDGSPTFEGTSALSIFDFDEAEEIQAIAEAGR
jgi:hypothetical protein